MFTKLANEIDFNDIVVFCGEWGEGVRVEYKREMTPKSLPKIISSFANTQGGIFIIGVETDKKQNKVKSPIQGIPNEDGIEERIVQSALTGIYPAVTPEVTIRNVPEETGNVVVVVRSKKANKRLMRFRTPRGCMCGKVALHSRMNWRTLAESSIC